MAFRFQHELQCAGKQRRFKREAKRLARRRSRCEGELFQAYKCPWCGTWHVGHVPPRMAQTYKHWAKQDEARAQQLNVRRMAYAEKSAAAA